jgi:hypothetical protein
MALNVANTSGSFIYASGSQGVPGAEGLATSLIPMPFYKAMCPANSFVLSTFSYSATNFPSSSVVIQTIPIP